MSHRSSSSRGGGHLHCDSCYSRRCRTRVEVSVSCALASCRLLCGAVFHLCKEEDHLLLCPNVRVPCINAGYGCPLQLPRCARAAHLQACPASVVSCSMEWNRWLRDDTEPHSQPLLRENVMKEWEEQRVEALELSMALVDQDDLYSRLKMKPMYPELVEDEEEEEEEEQEKEAKKEEEEEKEAKKEETSAVGGLMNGNEEPSEDRTPTRPSLSTPPPDSVTSSSSINVDTHRLFEMMFSMDKGGCTAAQENLKQEQQEKKKEEEEEEQQEEDGSSSAGPVPDPGKTGQAPWQEGVLERLREDLTPQEYNMYMVHHGRMLLAFGQIEACTPRDRDFVYGGLEPIPVQTLRSFKVPDSYHYRRRVHLYDAAARVQSEARSTDTSDLGGEQDEDAWFSDEAEATLLGYAEREVMGHKVSAPTAADGLYCDVGTQTHWFRAAPFRSRRMTLAQVMERRPLTLQLRLQAESVTGRHHRGTSVFTFVCGHTFHRKEFATHFRNVHADIQTCVSGWFEQRCPLAYLGCTYTWRRFQPSTHRATVTYSRELRSFNLRPIIEESPGGGSGGGAGGGGGEDPLSSLPYELLCHLASFLDSLSLSQLALVSHLMRQVVWSLLQDRGTVSLRWDRHTSSHRSRSRWTSKPVWTFSPLFSPVDSWHMSDGPPVSAHLKVCPYYHTSARSEPVLLPGMTEASGEGGGRGGPSLVHLFRTRGGPQ